MENIISRYRNVTILVAILFVQVLGLAVQVKRATDDRPTRLIRVWAVDVVTPLEKSIVWFQHGVTNLWHNYFYLRGVRQENRDLKQQIENLRIEQTRMHEDAEQARRLQLLLGFKEQFISRTIAAQVIGLTGSDQSRAIYLDKGAREGIRPDMAVVTADGVIGKVLRVYGANRFEASVSQVLLINDQTSGVGVILEKSRLQGVLRGTPLGEVVLEKVMSDETVQPGDRVLTSGGDRIFPKGLPVGTVTKVSPGPELFLNIRVKPTADLGCLEEVLIITQQEEREPIVAGGAPMRAADILAQRLPSVPDRPPDDPNKPPPPTSGLKILPAPGGTIGQGSTNPKPGANVTGSSAVVKTAPALPRTAVASDTSGKSGSNSATIPLKGSPVAKPAPKPASPPIKTQATGDATQATTSNQVKTKPSQSEPPPQQPAAAPTPPQDQPQ